MQGPIDVLINNAGWDVFRPFLQTDPELWGKIIDINYEEPLIVSYYPSGMSERGRGRVVSVSDAARVGSSGESVYAACKAGIVGLRRHLPGSMPARGLHLMSFVRGPQKQNSENFMAEGQPDKLAEAFAAGQWDVLENGRPAGAVVFGSEDAAYITGRY